MTNKALASAFIAVLVVLPSGGVGAQAEASKPAGIAIEQGKRAAGQGETKPMTTAVARGKRPVRVNEDARHCLELATIAEIVKCAEPYRY